MAKVSFKSSPCNSSVQPELKTTKSKWKFLSLPVCICLYFQVWCKNYLYHNHKRHTSQNDGQDNLQWYIHIWLFNKQLFTFTGFFFNCKWYVFYVWQCEFHFKILFFKSKSIKKKHYIKNSTKDKAKIEKMSDKQKSLVNFDPEPYTPAVLNQKLQKWGPEIYIFNKYSQMIFIH